MKKHLMKPEEIELEDRAFDFLNKAKQLGMKGAAEKMNITFDELLKMWKWADERQQDNNAELVDKLCEVSRVLKDKGTNLDEQAVRHLIKYIGCQPE